MKLTLSERLPPTSDALVDLTLALTAEERTRSRHRFLTLEGQTVQLHLPRGTVLQDGDLLRSPDKILVRVTATPEPVMTVKAKTNLDLLRAAYHLGNRHVSLEITVTHLRLAPDPVLKSLLEQLGLQVVEEVASFHPEIGAYGHSYTHHVHAH